MKKSIKALSSVLCTAILAGVFWSAPFTATAANGNSNLPFTVEETDYAVHAEGVKAKKIMLKEDTSAEFRGIGYYSDDPYINDGCFFIDDEKDDGSIVNYLVGKKGLVKSFTSKSDENKASVTPVPDVEYADDARFPDELYAIYNPETGKMDLYNQTKDVYYDYAADAIEATYYGSRYGIGGIGTNDYEIGLIVYKKNNKLGLLDCEGKVLYEPIYDSINGYKNALVGYREGGIYTILSRDGTTDGNAQFRDVLSANGIVWGAKVDTNGSYYCNLYDPDTLQKLIDVEYASDAWFYHYRNRYYFAVRKQEGNHYKSYIVSGKETLCLNTLYNYTSVYIPDSGVNVDWSSGGCAWEGSVEIMAYNGDDDPGNYVWLSPDGKTEYKSVPNDGHHYWENWSLKGHEYHEYYDKNKRLYEIKKSDGTPILGDIPISSLKRYGNVLILTNANTKLDTYYDFTTGKIICSEVHTNGHEYHGARPYINVILSEDQKSFGLVDLRCGTFSGYKFKCENHSFADGNNQILIEDVYSNSAYVNDVRDLKWICLVSFEDDNDNTEKCWFINSDYKLIAEGNSVFFNKHEFLLKKNDMALTALIGCADNNSDSVCLINFNGIQKKTASIVGLPDYLKRWQNAYAFMIQTDNDDSSDQYGVLTDKGYVIVRPTLSNIGSCHNGLVFYENDDYSGIINRDGRRVISGRFRHYYSKKNIRSYNHHQTIALAPDNDDNGYHISCMIIYDYSAAMQAIGADEYIPDRLPDWDTNNSTFRLGIDTNDYFHNSIDDTDDKGNILSPAGFKGVKNYWISPAYTTKLLASASATEAMVIMSRMNSKWGGSCYGIASTICLTHGKQINPSSIIKGATNYHELGQPYKNSKFLNTVLYYDLAQCLGNKGVSEDAMFSCDIYNPDYTMPLSRFLKNFTDVCRKKSAVVLGMNDVNGHGHAIVACGCYTDKEKDKYVVRLYDENTVYSGSPLGQYAYMYINSDFSNFTIEGDITYSRENLKVLTCLDLCGKSVIEAVGAGETASNTEKRKMYVEIDANKPFTMKNENEDKLYFDGTYHNGELYVYRVSDTVEGDTVRTVYEIDYSESLLIIPKDEDTRFCVYTDNDYYNVEATGLDQANIQPGNSISLIGEDMEYSVKVNNPQSKGAEVIGFSGKKANSVEIENEETVSIGSEWNFFNPYSDVSISKLNAEGETIIGKNLSFRLAEINNDSLYLDKKLFVGNVKIGDTNLDGLINIGDVTTIQGYLAEFELFSDDQLALADTNGDGKVDIGDATHLQKYLAEFDGIVLGKA